MPPEQPVLTDENCADACRGPAQHICMQRIPHHRDPVPRYALQPGQGGLEGIAEGLAEEHGPPRRCAR